MEFEDCSPWHHLIFVEELADDVSNKGRCVLCYEQASGPVYKCLECDFIQHKSCPKPTKSDWEERMKYHYFYPRHHLILVEEMENNGKEEVCDGCEEPLSTPAYKCFIPGCSFVFHQPCAQLPHVVQHPTHEDYMLTLQGKRYYENPNRYASWYKNLLIEREGKKCNFCLKTSKYLFYLCEPFDFHLHIKCLPLWQNRAYGRHKHTVFITLMPDPFTCQACGEESKFAAYTCDICRLIMEKSCCDFSHTIQTTLHGHYLTFTYSVRQINKQSRIFCRLCRKQVNTKYGAYYCVRCGFTLHLKCARRYEERDATMESVPRNCDEYSIYLVEGLERFDGPEKVQHFNHPQHELLLKHEEPGYDKRCEACMRFIFFVPYYGCVQCNFFLHSRCAKLPTTIYRGLFHEHPLTLVSQALSKGMVICCEGCGTERDGYTYKCDKCDYFELDVQCALIPEDLQHILHKHTIFLTELTEWWEKCNNCSSVRARYICIDGCKFKLCLRCLTLPLYIRYRYHSHPLTLIDTCDNYEEYYCLICEEKRDPKVLFYWCQDCDFTVHLECILKGHFKFGDYVSKDHEHPLTLMQKTKDFPPCDACGQPFVRSYRSRETWFDFLAVECTQCKFVIHRRCQTATFAKPS